MRRATAHRRRQLRVLYCTVRVMTDRRVLSVRHVCTRISQILPRATADNSVVGGVINDARTVRPL